MVYFYVIAYQYHCVHQNKFQGLLSASQQACASIASVIVNDNMHKYSWEVFARCTYKRRYTAYMVIVLCVLLQCPACFSSMVVAAKITVKPQSGRSQRQCQLSSIYWQLHSQWIVALTVSNVIPHKWHCDLLTFLSISHTSYLCQNGLIFIKPFILVFLHQTSCPNKCIVDVCVTWQMVNSWFFLLWVAVRLKVTPAVHLLQK